jgi:hypothetical protein
MTVREPRPNEVRTLTSPDERECFAIVRRGDGFHEIYVDRRSFDEEESRFYWSSEMARRGGLYKSIEEAEREVRSWPGGDALK